MDVREVLACPLSKQSLELAGGRWHAPSGLSWPDGDFRVALELSHDWTRGQDAWEAWSDGWFRENDADPRRMEEVDRELEDVYAAIELTGDVLDVGGSTGSVVRQAGLDPDRYVCVDPHLLDPIAFASRFPRYAERYAAGLGAPRLLGHAEFLPIRDNCFDTVHVRSAIDHFASPPVALLESFRVLRPGGKVVVGTSLEGAYHKGASPTMGAGRRFRAMAVAGVKSRPRVEAAVRRAAAVVGKLDDHHVFHPTRELLLSLLTAAGFELHAEVWQATYHNVLYVDARKPT